MSTTDSDLGKEQNRDIFRDEKARYQNDRKLERSKDIDYDNLNESRTDILSKYSFTIRMEVVDETGKPMYDRITGKPEYDYITVRTNKRYSRKTILDQADRRIKGKEYGRLHRRGKIVSGLRKK